jgi:hypothetical protein
LERKLRLALRRQNDHWGGAQRDDPARPERRSIMLNTPNARPATGFFARLTQMLAATDQFVTWWGEHRAWPANEKPRIGRLR